MKIVVIGASGLIGSAVVEALAPRHHVITASRRSTTHPVGITDPASIRRLFDDVGRFDAVIAVAGGAAYKPLLELTDEDFAHSLTYKLMGQVNVARLAVPHLNDRGSITLTSGSFADEPPPSGSAIALVNAGLDGFVRGAATELPRGIRINAVSPPIVGELLFNAPRSVVERMPASNVALAFVDAVEGHGSGRVIDARAYARR